jgi:nicotinamidase-related amidase
MPSKTALIVVDMINSYDHPDGEKLAESVEQALPKMAELISRAEDQDAQVIYVNDNFGAWNSNREELVEEAMKASKELIEPIRPKPETAFVVKARHSIFYETPLAYLLRGNEIDRVVLIGQATEQCILYSALDAHIRHFDVVVPRDAVAHIHEHLAEAAFEMMETNMGVDVCDADDVRFASA